MRIAFHKGTARHTLSCVRDDGTTTRQEAGPGLPFHDLAHYVAESTLGLRLGFFGMVAAGRSLRELSDPEVIRTLGEEAMVAEVLARAVGSMATGACRAEDLSTLLLAELAERLPLALRNLSLETVRAIEARYAALSAEWRALPDGATLTLPWD
jgi:hypothetical protein